MGIAVRAGSLLVAVCVGVLGLAGCASALGGVGTAGGSSGGVPPSAWSSPSATPTPMAACPQQPGVELPPECAGYDPEQSMAQNDRHRERMSPAGDAPQAGPAIDAARAALADLVASGSPLTAARVERALSDAGLRRVQVREDGDRVLFGTSAPSGGCIFGEVGPAVHTDAEAQRDADAHTDADSHTDADAQRDIDAQTDASDVSASSGSGRSTKPGAVTVRVEAGGLIRDGGCLAAN